ncbi:hypothetical protein T484DRAFT_2609167 [Baffinella frigidus]|nr:hypothetical protein T484DRAFT_2609167 [Cryptophyta sp. CCMP2293]
MAAEDAVSGVEKGLGALSAQMVKFQEKLANLLVLMTPIEGKDADVDGESDAVEEVSSEIDATLSQLAKDAKEVRAKLTELAAAPSPRPAEEPQRRQNDESRTPSDVYEEVASLRSSLSEVTFREKERVEGLSVQLEMSRQELADTRNQRRLEQASLASAESQCSQLRAALACAEDDLKSLRLTLDNELVRSQRLQAQASELNDELRSSRRSAPRPASAGPGRPSSAGPGSRNSYNSGGSGGGVGGRGGGEVEDLRFGTYMADRRSEVESWDRDGFAPRGSGAVSTGAARAHGVIHCYFLS